MRNWARNQTCVPSAVRTPSTTDEVATIVAEASRTGRPVKAIGAGHSFTAAAMTNGVLVTLDGLNAVERVDAASGRVTVQAGIRLRDLCDELAAVGLAMPNLGDINSQSIAGAISTATHGTGAGLGNLATTIVGMELVDGSGNIVTCDDTAIRPDLLRVARVGVGALGIITKVTIQCVPAFDLHARETIEALDDVLDDFANFATSAEHAEFYWMPGTRRCQVKRNDRTTEPARPQSRLAYVRDKYVAENAAFGLVCRFGRRFPAQAPRLAKLITSFTSERDLIDRSDHIFCSPRRVRFVEMEYGIPVEAIPDGGPACPRPDGQAVVPAAVPDRGAGLGGRRHPVVDRSRQGERVDRGAPVPRSPVRVVLPGRRGDHGRLRRPAALGEAALPVGVDAARPVPAMGSVRGRQGRARSGRDVPQRVHRSRARATRPVAGSIPG